MYLIDIAALKSHVTLSRSLYSFEEAKDHDKVTFYLKICLDIIINVVNDKKNNIEDAYFIYVEDKYNDPHINEMGQFLVPIIKEIRLEFAMKGYDPRLMYALKERKRGSYSQYVIQMDLEETFLEFHPYVESDETLGEMVSEHPDQDMINQLLESQVHPGR